MIPLKEQICKAPKEFYSTTLPKKNKISEQPILKKFRHPFDRTTKLNKKNNI